METEKRVTQAKEVIRDLLARYSKPHHRIHGDAALDNANRLRALEGLCGHCHGLNLRFGHRDGKNIVSLGCTEGNSPVALYDNTLPGEKASCPDY
ncbi:hypothetical protein MUP46_00115 [Patescibacteria group bacterium]|nr:hypothetical protein [Patescibacteria group bacterium]